jgi:hypothetical protein
MDLNTIVEAGAARLDEPWRDGDAWLAGGTYLFSEPQPHLRRLRDLTALDWPALTVTASGLEIAATCTVAQLARFGRSTDWPAGWHANSRLINQCCEAFLASFKVWNLATVGGNLCNSLPAGPMISLTAALDATCNLHALDGSSRQLPVHDFVTGDGQNALRTGELLRSITVPAAALSAPTSFRRTSLHEHGRSATLLIGRRDDNGFILTITASTTRPVQLRFPSVPTAAQLRSAIDVGARDDWFDDIHGLPVWRQHMTFGQAEEIRVELDEGTP